MRATDRAAGGARAAALGLALALACVAPAAAQSAAGRVASAADEARDQARVQACHDKADTQFDMNRCAGQDYELAERALNQVYRAVLARHAEDALLVQKLRAAQAAWLRWRAAELAALYPEHDKRLAYGSVYPMCQAAVQAGLMRERTAQLRRWLDGVKEGDVCSGSLPLKP